MSMFAILALGFVLGMRHATDADHVVAVSAIVARQRTLRAAAPVGVLWGIGHTLTLGLVGSAIILFGLVIPPHVGLGMEFCVGLMLVLLGGLNLWSAMRERARDQHTHSRNGYSHDDNVTGSRVASLRPLIVGTVHGLAGSAAIALLVLGTIRSSAWAFCYLLVFGVGTIAGMLLITTAMALPIVVTAHRFERFHGGLAVLTGVLSVAFGSLLVYDIGFVHGLFTAHPHWTPQ